MTTAALDRQRQELLVAAAGYFGHVERWGEREVLVDRGSPVGVAAAFVDGTPTLVVVAAAREADARTAVQGLNGLDPSAWGSWLQSVSDDLAAQAVAASAPVGAHATLTERQPEGDDPTSGSGGHCLELPETDPVCRPAGSSVGGAEGPQLGVGHRVLVAGDWWYFGYVPGMAVAITVTPDRGPEPDVDLTGDDDRTWFAVQLPPTATTASVRIDAPGLTGSADAPPPTIDLRRPAS